MNERELATVLAALRHWQEIDYQDRYDISSHHFIDHTPLENDEIDLLCETLNINDTERETENTGSNVNTLKGKDLATIQKELRHRVRTNPNYFSCDEINASREDPEICKEHGYPFDNGQCPECRRMANGTSNIFLE